MKKKLGILLALCMLIGIVAATGITATATEKVTLLVDSETGNDETERANNACYKTIAGALTKSKSGDTIRLMSDVTENVEISQDMNITLDLNDHVLSGNDPQYASIVNYGTLYITDNSAEPTTHYFTDEKCAHGFAFGEQCDDCASCPHGNGAGTYCIQCCIESGYTNFYAQIVPGSNVAKQDGFFETRNDSYDTTGKTEGSDYITFSGGYITGGTGLYGGIFSSGTLYLQGGSIALNNVNGYCAVANVDGTFTMSGGNIIGNCTTALSAYGSGVGGVWNFVADQDLASTVNIEGGSICYNSGDLAGGIRNDTGAILMVNGGYIEHNSSSAAGGIYNSGRMYMNSGYIEHNSGTYVGGILNAKYISMTGGRIESNNGSNYAGGVLGMQDDEGNDSEMVVGGTAYIYGNTVGTDANNLIIFFSEDDNGDFISNPISLDTEKRLTDGAKIGVTSYLILNLVKEEDIITSNGYADDTQYFISDDNSYYVKFVSDHLELAKATGVKVNSAEHGRIWADDPEATAGKTINIDVQPDDGYILTSLTAEDAEGNPVTVNGTSITLPASRKLPITVSATFEIPKYIYNGLEDVREGTFALEVNHVSAGEFEITEKGSGFTLKYGEKYLVLGSDRKLTTTTDENKASIWKYDGGLYVEVAGGIRYTGWFHTPTLVRYYLTADKLGNLSVSLQYASAQLQTVVRSMDAPITLTYQDEETPVLWFTRHTNAFEIGNVPDGTSVAYSLGYKWSVGDTFSVRYLPETIQIRVTAEDGTVTQWQAKLVGTAYEVSLVK